MPQMIYFGQQAMMAKPYLIILSLKTTSIIIKIGKNMLMNISILQKDLKSNYDVNLLLIDLYFFQRFFVIWLIGRCLLQAEQICQIEHIDLGSKFIKLMNYIRFNIFSTRNLMLPVAFIVFLTYHIPEIITQSTPGCFNTMMITLFSWSGPTNSYNPQGYHHPFSYTVAQSDYQEHYFSVSAYKIDIQGISFSYECNLQNVTSTGAVMYFNPSIHSYIVSIQFCVILKQPCSGEIFMKSIDYQPITNNPTNPIISQLTEIYVDKPFGNGINRYITQAYVSSFITGTTIGSYFKMNIALQPIQPGLNYQKILINMDQQILQKIKFLYLLIDLHSFIKLPLFEIYTTVVSSPPVTMSQYFAPNQFQKCILGMVYSQVKTVATSTYEIQLSLGSLSYDYLAASNNQVLSSVFCMAFCYPWQYPYPTSPSIYYNKCAACPIGCINCANLTFCITCKTSYYLLKVADYHQLCNPCLQDCLRCNDLTNCTQCFVGMTTQNGCSFGQSCSRVDRFYIYTDNRCTLCIHPSFLVSNRTCICPVKYFMVAGLCTNVIGCSSTELKANGDIICLSCKFLENFLLQPQNQKCICKENYELVGDKCVQKCGDGIRFDLQCDDGNNVNMDGCSSTCIVESGFACTKRINKADRCVYIRRDIRLLLKSVHKISLQNKAIFTFNIFPTFLNQKWVNISNQSFFRTTRKIQILQKTHQNGQLIIFLQYFEDLQDYQAQINLNINYYYALQNNYTTTIKMQDHGKLVFISNVQMLSILQFIYFSINLLIVAIFFISMFIHKMIVIQLLIPIQLLYLTFSFFGEESSVTSLISFAGMSCFDMLSSFNSFLNPYKQQNQLQNVYHSFLFTSFLQIAIFCLFIILFLIVKNFENKECKKKLMSKLQKIYNCFLFPLSIALMLIFQSYYSFWQLNKYLSFIEKCLNIILVKLVGLVYFFQWKIILTQKNSKVTKYETNDFKQKYVGAYLSFVLIFSTILQLWVIGHEQYAQIYLILLTIGFIVFTIFYRPYSKIFSNFGIVINFLPTLYVIMYIMLRKHEFIQTISEQDSLINVVIVIVLILCSIIVTIARLIIIIKQRFKIKEQIKNKDNISVQPKQKSPKVMKGISQIIKNDLNYFYACKTIQDGIKSGDNGFNYIHNQNKDHVYRNLKAILLEKAKSIAKKRSQK